MKKLVGPNTTLTFYTPWKPPAWSAVKKAFENGVEVVYPTANTCASGRQALCFVATLVSGGRWYYLVDDVYDFEDSIPVFQDMLKWHTKDGSIYGVGEGWNLVYRARVTKKIAEEDFQAFLDSH